jgi:hypothetical protein
MKNTEGSAMSVGSVAVQLQYGLYVFGHLSKWFVFVLMFNFWSVSCLWNGRPTIGYNVSTLGEGGDFGDENCLPPLNLIRSTKLHLSTEPPISCRCCYAFVVLFLSSIFVSFRVCLGAVVWWLFCCFLLGYVRLEKLQMCHQLRWVDLFVILIIFFCPNLVRCSFVE